MPRFDKEYERYVAKRRRDLLRGRVTALPSEGWETGDGDPILEFVAKAINRAYAQGWVDAEMDVVDRLTGLRLMADDARRHGELWDTAQKARKSEDAGVFRRDWLESNYAREQLERVGVNPNKPRPQLSPPVQIAVPRTKKAKSAEAKQVKKAKAKAS